MNNRKCDFKSCTLPPLSRSRLCAFHAADCKKTENAVQIADLWKSPPNSLILREALLFGSPWSNLIKKIIANWEIHTSKIEDIHFNRLILMKTRIFHSRIENTWLSGCGLDEISLETTIAELCQFENTSLINLSCIHTSVENCVFRDCNFKNSRFLNLQIRACQFEKCLFDSIEFLDCNFEDTSFSNCRFYDCKSEGHSQKPQTNFCFFNQNKNLFE